MPYENEHSARLRDPDDFKEQPDWAAKGQKFARKADGKIYGRIKVPNTADVIWGQLKSQSDQAAAPQSIRFPIKNWTAAQAKKWLKDNNVKTILFEPAKGSKTKAKAIDCNIFFNADSVVDIKAAESSEDNDGLPRFTMTAYTGGAMMVDLFWRPVVIELAGMDIDEPLIICKDHDNKNKLVGHGEGEKTSTTVKASGIISGTSEAAREVLANSQNGFPWRASVGAKVLRNEFVPEGQKVKVNGKNFNGPINVVRKSVLQEVSFVSLAADSKTKTKIAAFNKEYKKMDFAEWLKAKGFEIDDLDEDQKNSLQAMYDAEQEQLKAAENTPSTPLKDKKGKNKVEATAKNLPNSDDTIDGNEPADPVKIMRANAAAESERISSIHKLCKGEHDELEAQAIREGWTTDKTELEVLRASRPTAPAILSGEQSTSIQVLEAAIRLGSNEPQNTVEKAYDEKTLDAADKNRRISLRGLIEACCRMEGMAVPSLSASVGQWVQAGFGTHSLSDILSNVAHKMMFSAYQAVPSLAVIIAKKLSTKDFKEHTGYRLTGDGQLPKVGSGGELKHGKLSDAKYAYQVDTYGKIIALTRQQWINDDLNAFTQIPLLIGRSAALTRENLFWTLLLANTGTFFGTGNKNYISGADTALGITGLDQAVQKLEEQVDSKSNPILVIAKYLVVPPALKAQAQRIWSSDNLIAIGVDSSEKVSAATNTHKGMYEPHSSPYLKAKTKEWYLFGNPNDVAAFGIAYLNGQESPTIEEVELPANYLGKAWRGYLDVGVCQVDPRGAVKSKGEA